MLWESWFGIWRVVAVGSLTYATLVVVLRLTGKRTLTKMNAFDLVVTVALGSTLASALLSKDVPLAEGVAGLALLVVLQLVVTWLSVRWRWIERAVKAEPTLLFYRGEFRRDAMRRIRVPEAEIRSAVRAARLGSMGRVRAVVMETSGDLSVVPEDEAGDESALQGAEGWNDLPGKRPANKSEGRANCASRPL